MSKFCGDCKYVHRFGENKPPCVECYAERDENGIRTKPAYNPRIKTLNLKNYYNYKRGAK